MCEPSQNNNGDEMIVGKNEKPRDPTVQLLVNDAMKEREVVLLRLSQLENFLIEQKALKKRTKERGKR